MKKSIIASGIILSSLLLGNSLFLLFNNHHQQVKATSETDMDNIPVESGEQLDTANMIYDDFSNGLNTNRWVVSKKAWGNSSVSYNSGVIPENVFYNSIDKTIIFRSLGDFYKDNDVNYDLHNRYGYAHDGSTGGGRVYSKDGTRTGGCIKTRDEFGPGRYEARFKAAPVEGICTAFWTFDYGSHGETDYNEMDFELPTYISDSNKDDLAFNRIICTTYYSEEKYKSQRVTNPVYLNDNEFHTYCLEWYYSNNVKKVKWFIDGSLLCECNDASKLSINVGRVTIGAWIPGRSSFCGIPSFDKAYMELDYFKYTPFKNQTNVVVPSTLADYSTSYTTVTKTLENDFVPQGSFNYGITDNFVTNKDVNASKSYNYGDNASSYGVKIAGENGTGVSYIQYTQPNIRGINKLKYSMNYKGYGSFEAYADDTLILNSGTLASPNNWTDYETELIIPSGVKTLRIKVLSESNDVGFYVDNLSLTYPEPEEPVDPQPSGIASYSFYAKTNGQTSDSSSNEKEFYPDLNSSRLWKTPAGKYYIKNNDANTIYIKPTTTVMSSDSSSYYYSFKTCLLNNGFAFGSKAALFAMEFDVDDFTDIEVALYSYSGVSGRTIYVLYSNNQGTSWSLLTSKSCSSMTGDGVNFRYNYRFVAPNNLKGQTLRFAIAGNDGGSEDGYRIASIFINNYTNFKERLDGNTCDLNDDNQAFLAHEYANLTNSELYLLDSEMMQNYSQTYAAGYNYLLNVWSGHSIGARLVMPIKENIAIIAMSISIFLGLATFLFFFIRSKKNINQ